MKILKTLLFNYACFLIDFVENNKINLQKNPDHNKRRISRIIITLKLMGEDKLADAFYSFAKDIASDGKIIKNPKNSLCYWSEYLKNTTRYRILDNKEYNLSSKKE